MTYSYHASVPHLRTGLTLQQPTGTWTQTANPDAAKRLSSLTSPAGTFTYTYKGPGLLWTNLALPSTAKITNAYDTGGRLTGTWLRNSGGTILNKHVYAYNTGGQRSQQTRQDASYVNYGYDNDAQLLSALGYTSGGAPIANETLGFTYDASWNLTQRTENGTPTAYPVNDLNQLNTVGGLACTYDANGNLISRVCDSNGPKTYTFTYDEENQLVTVNTDTYYMPAASRWKSEFTYDGRGRVRKRVDYTWNTYGGAWQVSGETRYVYDGMRVIQERNSANTPTVAYTRGNDLSGSLESAGGIGGLLARSDTYSSGSFTRHHGHHADGNGNVTALVDSAQALAATYKYDPYGRLVSYSGTMAGANTYRFSSKDQMPNSGLYYYGYRFYDPNLQRWLNRDPAWDTGFDWRRYFVASVDGERHHLATVAPGGISLYRFCSNQPVVHVDPLGLVDEACMSMCEREAGDRQGKIDHAAKCVSIGMGIGGFVGGTLLTGDPLAGVVVGGIHLVGWWIIIDVGGTVGNAYGLSACYLGCIAGSR